jgi:hypothetical protein
MTDPAPLPSSPFRSTLGAAASSAGRGLWRAHRPFALVTAGSAALLVAALVLQVVDPRQVLGAPTWLKPAKFAAAILVTSPALAWIIRQMTGSRARRLHGAGTVMAVVSALELVAITVQAARGVPSHFNNETSLDAAIFAVMGLGITIFWFAELLVAVAAFRHRFASAARTWAIRLGLAGTLVGGAVGFFMPRPTPSQLVELRAGERPSLVGAHTIGAPDGGPGLPVTRWSRAAGDLRVPHFLGLHALQALPLLAFALERRGRREASAVIAVGVAWLGLTFVALAQALRGQPVLAPDGATLAAALGVVLASLAIARLTGAQGVRQPTRSVATTTSS